MTVRLAAALVAAVTMTASGCDHPVTPTPPCVITVSPAASTFGSDGGSSAVDVSASAASCAWVATTTAEWVSIVGGTSGVGSGKVEYRVFANPSMASRNGAVVIANQTHAVSQQGRPAPTCEYALSPSSASVASGGGDGTVAVAAPDGCAWSAISSAAWLTVSAGAQGIGNGVVSYTVARNRETADRHATIDVADQTFKLTQSGEPVACDYSVAPVQLSSCMNAGTAVTRIDTAPQCSWTISASVPWLTVSADAGSGSADITMAFTSNYDAPREGIVMVRWPTPSQGQNVRLSQAGCIYSVTRSTFSIGAGGASDHFDVVQQSLPNECGGPLQDKCVWTAAADVPWITVTTPMPQTGDGRVAFTVAPNGGPARTGRITVRDKGVTIGQAGS